jgi:exosortase
MLLVLGFIFLVALLLLPFRIIAIANPDWRLISWGMAVTCLLITLCIVYLVGGKSWLRHFCFPFAFFLVAVPWPTQIEQALVQNLMRADALITVALCNAVGTIALAHNNVIELSTGMVGIDDACTGVRSLQATFMISLFLGEFYLMKVWQRFFLIGLGAVLAFFCNIVRTFILCMIGATRGIAAIHSWHDSAGLTILLACLFGLWAISLKLRPRAGE